METETGRVSWQEGPLSIVGQRLRQNTSRVAHPPDSRGERGLRSEAFASVSFSQAKAQPPTRPGRPRSPRHGAVSSEPADRAALGSPRPPRESRYLAPLRRPGAQKNGHVELVLVLRGEERPGRAAGWQDERTSASATVRGQTLHTKQGTRSRMYTV